MPYYGYFSEINITLPTEVRNSIEDVFLENDNVENVQCYHLEDLEQFQEDLTLHNFVEIQLKGANRGQTNNVWTYYGNMSYSLSETINLVADNDGEILEEISNVQNDEKSILETPDDYVVVLHEIVSWDSDDENLTRELALLIYCPIQSEPDEEDPYEDLYNELKSEVEYGAEL